MKYLEDRVGSWLAIYMLVLIELSIIAVIACGVKALLASLTLGNILCSLLLVPLVVPLVIGIPYIIWLIAKEE